MLPVLEGLTNEEHQLQIGRRADKENLALLAPTHRLWLLMGDRACLAHPVEVGQRFVKVDRTPWFRFFLRGGVDLNTDRLRQDT
jgi:hypothetical protein